MGYCVQLNIDDWAAGFAQLKGRDIKGFIPHLPHSSRHIESVKDI